MAKPTEWQDPTEEYCKPDRSDDTKSNCLVVQCCSNVPRVFAAYGRFVAHHSYLFLITPLVLSTVVIAICAATCDIRIQAMDHYSDYSSTDSVFFKKSESLMKTFDNVSRSRVERVKRFVDAEYHMWGGILLSKGDENMLKFSNQELAQRIINEAASLTINCTGTEKGTFRYRDVCPKLPNLGCQMNPVVTLLEWDWLIGIDHVHYPVTTVEAYGTEVFTGAFVGDVGLGKRNTLKSAKTLLLAFYIDAGIPKECSTKWLLEMMRISRENEERTPGLKMRAVSLDYELLKSEEAVIGRMQVASIIVAVGLVALTMFSGARRSGGLNKSWLMLGSLFSAGLATLTAFALLLLAGHKLALFPLASTMITIPLGLDDAFILLSAYWHAGGLQEREASSKNIGRVLRTSGAAITLTTITDLVAFGIGISCSYKIFSSFCLFATLGITVVYLYQMTFFVALMAFSVDRDHKVFCATFDQKVYQAIPNNEKGQSASTSTEEINVSSSSPRSLYSNKPYWMARIFQNHYSKILLSVWFQAFGATTFLIYLFLSIYGVVSKGRAELTPFDFVSANSSTEEAFKMYYTLNYTMIPAHLWFDRLDDQSTDLSLLLKLQAEVERFSQVSAVGSLYVDWLNPFLKDKAFLTGLAPPSVQTSEIVLSHMQGFLQQNPSYYADVKFVNGKLSATRFVFALRNWSSTTDFENYVLSSKLNAHLHIAYASNADTTPLVDTILQLVIPCSVAVFVVVLLALRNLVASICVGVTMLSIACGVVGLPALVASTPVSIATVFALLIGLGFAVDYGSHVSYVFFSKTNEPIDKRVRKMLRLVATPIVYSAVSNLIGMIGLIAVNDRPVITTVGYICVVYTVLALMHGLMWLPVMFILLQRLCSIIGKKFK